MKHPFKFTFILTVVILLANHQLKAQYTESPLEFSVGEPFLSIKSETNDTEEKVPVISVSTSQPLNTDNGSQNNEDLKVSTDESFSPIVIKAYPNPFASWLTIEVEGFNIINGSWILMDLSGNLIGRYPITRRIMNIDFEHLASGPYILHYANESGHVDGSYKVIKQ